MLLKGIQYTRAMHSAVAVQFLKKINTLLQTDAPKNTFLLAATFNF